MEIQGEKKFDNDIRQAADDSLMDALLVHVNDSEAEKHLEERVSRVMESIDRSEIVKPYKDRVARVWFRSLSAAAAAVIAVGLFVFVQLSTPALAGVSEIIQALRSPGDRTYIINVARERASRQRKPQAVELMQPLNRPGLDGATLYLRNGESYLLSRIGPNGHAVLDGFDGSNYWRSRKGALVEENEDPLTSKLPMPELMAGIPFGDLASAIESIVDDYEISDVTLDACKRSGVELCYLKAQRRSRDVRGPSFVEIWAEPETGLPVEIIFHHAKFQGSHMPQRLTLILKSQSNLPDAWFAPSMHLPAEL